MINSNFSFRFKLPTSPAEAFCNIKNNLLSMMGLPKIILSGILSAATYLNATHCFYSEQLLVKQPRITYGLVDSCYINKHNQTFLIDGARGCGKDAPYFIIPLSVACIVFSVYNIFYHGRSIYCLSHKLRSSASNKFLLNKLLEKSLKREAVCVNWVKLSESILAISGSLTLLVGTTVLILCIQPHKKFSKYHCFDFSKVMYASSVLFLTQSGVLLCLKAYGPSKKEQVFLELEQIHGMRGLLRNSDISQLRGMGIKIRFWGEQDKYNVEEEIFSKELSLDYQVIDECDFDKK